MKIAWKLLRDTNTLKQIPHEVWVLGFVSLLMDISSEMIHSLLPLFMVSLGASGTFIGLMEGVAESIALLTKVFSGVLSDFLRSRKGLALLGYGLAALTKPFFALAQSGFTVLGCRFADRIGKGLRGAPRDALVADSTPRELLGAAYGLRQSLDAGGAFLGPLLAVGLMFCFQNDFRAVFWVACVPGILSVILLWRGIQEPKKEHDTPRKNPLRREELCRLPQAFWWVVAVGTFFSLARFSQAFLVLRASDVGLYVSLVPFVMVVMNLVFALASYPLGKLADKVEPMKLLGASFVLLAIADLLLARTAGITVFFVGIVLWGLHLGASQGLLSVLVARACPQDLRGTGFGLFNLASGIAMFAASFLAGILWDHVGPAGAFYAGALFTALALCLTLGAVRALKELSC